MVELRDGRYVILTGIGDGSEPCDVAVTILIPGPSGQIQPEKLPLQAFQAIRAGGMLHFLKINTALVCFSSVAREHKIELTRERLLHEYNLGVDEIPKDTLLRMAKVKRTLQKTRPLLSDFGDLGEYIMMEEDKMMKMGIIDIPNCQAVDSLHISADRASQTPLLKPRRFQEE